MLRAWYGIGLGEVRFWLLKSKLRREVAVAYGFLRLESVIVDQMRPVELTSFY